VLHLLHPQHRHLNWYLKIYDDLNSFESSTVKEIQLH
jgi:hypothetical protein